MRRLLPTCLLLSSLGPLGCFEDLPPLPGVDDDFGESTNGTTTDDESSDAEATSTVHGESDSTDESTMDGETGLEGMYAPCGEGLSCSDGAECVSVQTGWFVFDICLPSGCSDSVTCPPPPEEFGLSSSCNGGGECVLDCENNLGCGDGLVCSGGHCYFNVFWGPCLGQEDCPEGSTCRQDGSTSSCVPFCSGDPSECPPIMLDMVSPALCIDNGCEIECLTEAECPSPMQCFANHCRYPGLMP